MFAFGRNLGNNFSFGDFFMRFYLKIFAFLFIFSSFVCAQDQTRPQKIEDLKKLTSELEQIQNQIQKIEAQRDEIAVELLGATEADRETAERIGAKAVRLFPDGLMDKLFYAPDEVGFSVYSFTEVAEYYFAPRLEYKNNALEFVKEERKNIGLIANIGDAAIETVNDQSREVITLAKYQPPLELKDIKSEYVSDKLTFGNKAAIAVGKTYLARVIRYGDGDAIFALKVYRQDTDESIILFVKKIKTFDAPQLKNDNSINQDTKPNKENPAVSYETAQKVQSAMFQKGFNDVTVDGSTSPMTLRGTIPKGKLAEAVQTAQENNGGKPVKNEMTEK